jgi:hypothetical protein
MWAFKMRKEHRNRARTKVRGRAGRMSERASEGWCQLKSNSRAVFYLGRRDVVPTKSNVRRRIAFSGKRQLPSDPEFPPLRSRRSL